MECYICEKENKTWEGSFCHKRKVHTCVDVHSRRYELELENATKTEEEKARVKARKCMFCPRYLRKVTMEERRKKHEEHFTWIKCKLCCREHREEEFKDHIRQHNGYSRNGHYMNSKRLEDLFSTEHLDDVQATLIELEAVDI